MSASRIEYSEKYADDDHEYRYVYPMTPFETFKQVVTLQ